MSTIEDGGPAFAAGAYEHNGGGCLAWQDGMSMRDYFAAKVMQGLACSDTTLWPHGANDSDDPTDALFMARTAYMIADAMLAARKGKS